MTYRNKRTGNVIIVPCRLEGPDWEEITEAKAGTAGEPGKAGKDKAPEKAAPKRKAVKKGADA